MNGTLRSEFSLQILLFSCCFVLCMSINYYSDCNDGSLLFWSHVFSCFNVLYSRQQCAKRFYYSFTKMYHNVIIQVTEPLDISYSACSLDFGPKVPFFGHERVANDGDSCCIYQGSVSYVTMNLLCSQILINVDPDGQMQVGQVKRTLKMELQQKTQNLMQTMSSRTKQAKPKAQKGRKSFLSLHSPTFHFISMPFELTSLVNDYASILFMLKKTYQVVGQYLCSSTWHISHGWWMAHNL